MSAKDVLIGMRSLGAADQLALGKWMEDQDAGVVTGTEGVAGAVDIYPPTASSGKLEITIADQTGDTTVTLRTDAMGQATTVHIPDPGIAASYLLQSTAQVTVAEANVLDGATVGTVVASKAVVPSADKDISSFRNLTAVNLKAGASGTAGTVDVFPATGSKGKLEISCTDQTGDTVVSVVVGAMAAARTLTVPDPGAAASFVMSEGAQTINGVKTFGSEHGTALGVGAKNGVTVAAAETIPVVHKTVLTCTATDLGAFGDEEGQGQFAGVKVYDWPTGMIQFLGATITGDITLTAPAIDTWNGFVGLGVEAPTDHQDATNKTGLVMTKVAVTQAVAKVAAVSAASQATALTESGGRWLDGRSSAKDLFLNLLVTDNGAHDNTITGTFTGTITFTWINLGA